MFARDRNDFSAVYFAAISARRGDTEEDWAPFHAKMERLLMPVRGETDADKDAKGNNNNGDDSSEDEMIIEEEEIAEEIEEEQMDGEVDAEIDEELGSDDDN